MAKAIDILIANKAERAAEREERRKRHEESEAAKQKRHEDMLIFRTNFLEVFTRQLSSANK